MNLSTVLAGMVMSTTVMASSLFPTQSDYYYQLGSSSDLYMPPVNKDQTITIGGSIHAGGLSCNRFNPVVSITNTLNDLKESFSGMPKTVIDNLTGSAAAYPMYKLQQSLPGVYNLLQNASAAGQNEFALRVADCQSTKRALEDGKSPITSLLSLSDSQGWIDAATRAKNGESIDINKTAKDIANKGEDYGLPWVHSGNSGGSNQAAINVISDIVIAGYNLSLSPSRKLDEKSSPDETNQKKNHFVQIWSEPKKAADWAVMVLGDIKITHKKSDKETQAGIGLSTLLQSCPKSGSSSTCVSNVAAAVWKLVDKDKDWALTEANLRKISASNILITDEIITSIQRMPREQQIMTVSKLSEEIAMQNLLDEAMMLRHLLQAGMQIQEVQNLKPAQDMLSAALNKLDKEIKALAFESEVRKKMMTTTLNLIMSKRHQDLANGMPDNTREAAFIKNGAVYRNSDDKDKKP